MAWRVPRYGWLHAFRDAIVESTNAETANEDALRDDRRADLCVSTDADMVVTFDRGTGTIDPINRFWIPGAWAGSGVDIDISLFASTIPTGGTDLLGGPTIPAADNGLPFHWDFADNTLRYLRLELSTTGGTDTISLGEGVATFMWDTVRGPAQGWTDEQQDNRLSFSKESGAIYSVALGPPLRRIEYDYRILDDTSDIKLFDDLLAAVGTYAPFLLDPAYDTEAPVWMRFDRDPRITEDSPAPRTVSYIRRRWDLEMLEALA
jgi:hypothetical protein